MCTVHSTIVYAVFPGLIVVTLKTHEVYSQVSEMFSPYFKYCAEQTACQQYCKDQDRDNQVFKAYLAVRSSLLEPLLSWPQKMIVAVVRNSTRLQSFASDWYSGAAHAAAHKILTSPQSCPQENWWRQPKERSRRNGRTPLFRARNKSKLKFILGQKCWVTCERR